MPNLSIYDLGRDVEEAVSEQYNDKIDELPVNQNGDTAGFFTVTIEWRL